MAAVQAASKSRFMEFLTTPWVDKTIAVIAVTPNTIELYHRYTDANLTFVRGVLGIQWIILIITMVLRRTPLRVTPNPWYWLLAFVATYGVVTFYAFAPSGTLLVSAVVPDALAIISVSIAIFARLSLGFSIGFVPADRGIVTRGAYRLVRHPIYTALFVGLLAYILRAYSPLNALLVVILLGLFMLKSLVEEWFLRDTPDYAAYLKRVHYR